MTFVGNRHKVIRINHTTYDGRLNQDSLNPRTHADFMVLAHEDDTDLQMSIHTGMGESLVYSTPPSNIQARYRKLPIPNKSISYGSDGLVATSLTVRVSRRNGYQE